MSDQRIVEAAESVKSLQRQSLIAIVLLFLSVLGLATYAFISDNRRDSTIQDLSEALAEQRQQFTECTASGADDYLDDCERPVTEDPQNIIKPDAAGREGPPGQSAYEIALKHGFIGDEKEWIDSLHGAVACPVGSVAQTVTISTYELGDVRVRVCVVSSG